VRVAEVSFNLALQKKEV